MLRFDRFAPEVEGRREALCTLGNGYWATRGSAPEAIADAVHYPGTYFAGVYNRVQAQLGEFSLENEYLVNAPNSTTEIGSARRAPDCWATAKNSICVEAS
jgi:trehalose/maltose hydrolase-like predicted phosphorylase